MHLPYHKALVPGFYLRPREVSIFYEKCHVFFREFLAAGVTHIAIAWHLAALNLVSQKYIYVTLATIRLHTMR